MVRALRRRSPSRPKGLARDLQVSGIFRTERALAITQAADERPAALFAEHVTVGQTPLADGFLHDGGEAARYAAEKAVPGIDDLVRRELLRLRLARRRSGRIGLRRLRSGRVGLRRLRRGLGPGRRG